MRKGLIFILCLCIADAYAQTLKKNVDASLLSIGSNQLSTDEFVYLYKKNHPKKEDYTEPKINVYLDLLINFKLKVVEASSRGYDTTRLFKKEFKSYQQELRKPYLATTDIVDSLTKEAYKLMKVEVKASHILLVVKEDATPADTLTTFNRMLAIRERIIGGEDFGKLADEASDEPSAKTNHGNLGYFTVFQMVYPFEQAAYSLKTGEISAPVRTRFGYHLIKVTDRRLASGEVEVSHIMLRGSPGNDTKVKNKIFEIYDQLQGGRSWDELCQEFSDDQATKNTGGRLRPFGVGALAAVPEFESMAFSLHEPGDVSDPFQSAYGWHIIRLERRIPIPSFNAVEATLKSQVSRDERVQLADRKALEKKKKAFGFTEERETFSLLMKSADSTLMTGKWKYDGDAMLRGRTLFSLKGNTIAASQFILYAEREQVSGGRSPVGYMAQLYEAFVKDRLEELEENMLMETNSGYKNLTLEYKEGILLFTIMEKEVWNRASEDTTGLRIFYGKNKEKFMAGERVRAYIFSTVDSVFLEQIRSKVASGDSIHRQELKKFKSVVAVRNYARGDSKAIDRVPWAIGLHTTKIDGAYYMVQIDNLVAPGIKPLDEAKAQAISAYQDYLEQKWVMELKSKYAVKVNKKGLKSVVRELAK